MEGIPALSEGPLSTKTDELVELHSLLGLAKWLASNLFRQVAEGGMAYSCHVGDHIATAGYVAWQSTMAF